MISFKELGKQGRMSNQLFQIANCVALALRSNDRYIFPPWEHEQYFNLHGCFSDNIPNTETYTEPHFHYAPIPYRPNLNLSGYFQSYKYFEDYQDVIHNLLTPKIGFGIKHGYTSLHIRRTDYLTIPGAYEQLDISYYEKAMKMIGSKNYIVFSDDIPWCRQNFTGDNITFSESRSAVEDLSLMSSCENQIMANSSYSWWGAWLNKNPYKKIIMPNRWFGPALPHNVKDLCPPEWIKI